MVNRAQKREAIKKLSLKKKREPVIVAEIEVDAGVIRLAKADSVLTVKNLELIGDLDDENAETGQVVALLKSLCADQESKDTLENLTLEQVEELMENLEDVLGDESEDSPKA